jgi:hypothetical protein
MLESLIPGSSTQGFGAAIFVSFANWFPDELVGDDPPDPDLLLVLLHAPNPSASTAVATSTKR